jgi:hypothetical protein
VQKQGVRKMVMMRAFLFERFGAGQPEVFEARVRHYLDCMPDPKTGLVFAPRCNMIDKLDSLEKEREYLVDMCPKDGKETTLTRLIIRKLPKEYDVAVKTVRDLHRFRAYGKRETSARSRIWKTTPEEITRQSGYLDIWSSEQS